jgi:cholesterol transport system auxiliary component
MRKASLPRRALQYLLIGSATLMVSSCVSLFPGENTPMQLWYELRDGGAQHAGVASPQAAKARPYTLLIGPVASTAFYDGHLLAFSADGRTRAYYQFAAWSERPAKRLGLLVERRLAGHGGFASVAQSTSGVRGQLLLNLRLDECLHDVSSTPGQAQLSFSAELIDWRSRTLIARRSFEGRAPVSEPNAAAAASALSQALGAQLDALTAWVETSTALLQ